MRKQVEFEPSRPVAPGESIVDALQYLEMSPENLAQKTHEPVDYVQAVLKGKAPITLQFAQRLEPILKVPADFWLRYDKQYRRLQQEAVE